jgi:hypothetical protein
VTGGCQTIGYSESYLSNERAPEAIKPITIVARLQLLPNTTFKAEPSFVVAVAIAPKGIVFAIDSDCSFKINL